MATWSNSLSAE